MRIWRLTPESEKFLHLDMLRFLAACGVMVYHFRNQWTFGETLGADIPSFEGLRLCVDLFFLISGIVITAFYGSIRTTSEFGRFLRRRFARLLPLHWATLLFYVCVGLAYMKIGKTPPEPSKYDWSCLPWNALLLHSFNICSAQTFNHVSWSISAEMFAYVLFPASLFLLRFRPWIPAVAGFTLIGLDFLLVPYVGESWTNWTYDWGALRCLPAFLIGMSAYGYRGRLCLLIQHADLWLAALVALFIAGVALVVSYEALVFLAYLIAVVALAADGQEPSKFVRFLAPMGVLTYGIYMLHPVVRTVLLSVLAKQLLHLGPTGQNLVICAAFLLTWAVAYVSYFAFETPLRKMLSRPAQRASRFRVAQ